jgi:hypothetical protein
MQNDFILNSYKNKWKNFKENWLSNLSSVNIVYFYFTLFILLSVQSLHFIVYKGVIYTIT